MTQTANPIVAPWNGAPPKAFSADDVEELKRSFAAAGYLVFKNVVSKDKLSGLRSRIIEEFERAKQSGRLFSGGGSISGHLNCFPGADSRFAYEALDAHGIIDLIRAISPKSMNKLNVGCNLNLPGSVAQHYHADGWFTGDFMIANIAVVDTEIANGAIDLLPGTQKRFYKYWQFSLGRAYRVTTRIPMEQGDVLIRTSTLWHRGMPNLTALPRPMLALTFGDPGSARFEDPFAAGDGGITFHENWYRTDFLGRLRERTFVAAPLTYSAYRFVTSLVGNKGYAG